MPATPGEPTRRAQRRDQRKEWSALDTATGFERCVRATLRELYGYVALLSGRDRRGAERVVSDVYRSLFRAAGAGHVTSVTLGALRSAARQAWVEEHRIELAVTDEVSRAPVSTIAELSALERAVLVLRHVNGMTTDRAAVELGRSEREIAALDAHAVRRLRGTDDTSGAWLRAYLGPSVSPTAGLVDRIVRHLAEPDPATAPDPTEPDPAEPDPTEPDPTDAPTAPIETVAPGDGAADGAVDGAGEYVDDGDVGEVGGGARGRGNAADEVTAEERWSSVASVETTELPVVERPTVEVPTIALQATDPSVDPAVDSSEGFVTAPSDDEPHSQPDMRRPRWALVLGAALVAGLVVALVWLALRGDPGDTLVSTPATSADAAAGPADDAGVGQSEDDADGVGAAATSQPVVAATVPAGAVELGFDPPCVERSGAEPSVLTWSGTLDTLGIEPALQIDLPESVDVDADPERAAPRPTTILRPDGVVVAVQPADGHQADETMIARVGLDGAVAWTRCFDGLLRVGSAPDVGVDLALRSEPGGLAWTELSIVDGTLGDELDAVQSGALDARPMLRDADADGPSLGFSYDSALGRSVLAGLDDGRVVWTAPDVLLPDDDAFRATTVGTTVLAQSCATPDDAAIPDDATSGCGDGELRGYDLATGELLWSRTGAHAVIASGDGVALVGDGSTWELIDVGTGAGVGRRWDDPTTFETGVDTDVGFVVQDGGALVVAQPGTVSVWLPGDVGDGAIRVAIP